MLKTNCKFRKTIKDLLEQMNDLTAKFDDLEDRYKQLKADLAKIKPAVLYKPVKGDEVDRLFAEAMIRNNCKVPVKRISPGKYLFGTRNIMAKIINGNLVIRVGGGYMSVDEFI